MKRPWLVGIALAGLPIALNPSPPEPPLRQDHFWTVALILHEARSITNDDWHGDDIYARARLTLPDGTTRECDTKGVHEDDRGHIFPDWVVCSVFVEGEDPVIELELELWDHDGTLFTGGDDQFDINPVRGSKSVSMSFRPLSQTLVTEAMALFTGEGACARGRIGLEGDEGDHHARVVFTVTASPAGALHGDSDGDGLPDAWEVCGVGGLDLAAMGADPLRKDLFLEIDWMEAADHSHAPWLPALIQSWEEMRRMYISNPGGGPDGVRLHIDVGDLFRAYRLDIDGDGDFEIDVNDPDQGGRDLDGDGVNESLDLDADGTADVGKLAALGGVTSGGNALEEMERLDISSASLVSRDGLVLYSFGPNFARLRDANFESDRLSVFRYGVFAHDMFVDARRPIECQPRGIAECITSPGCDNFIVALGRSVLQPLLDEFGNPDADRGNVRGPTGTPVHGSINEHAAVLLHELGHTLSLVHEGIPSAGRTVGGSIVELHFKPNFLSIMNYAYSVVSEGIRFDENGDGMADRIEVDLNRDGFGDEARFPYSPTRLRTLWEDDLDETQPLLNRGLEVLLGPSVMTLVGPAPYRMVRADGTGDSCRGINWIDDERCEESVSSDVTHLLDTSMCAPPLAEPTPGDELESVAEPVSRIATGGMEIATSASALPELSHDDVERLRANLRRAIPLESEEALADDCLAPLSPATFEDLAVGTEVRDQYGPGMLFETSPRGRARIIDPPGRAGRPTRSPEHSLRVEPEPGANRPPPLRITFVPGVRMVGLSVGRPDLGGPGRADIVRVTALDENERSMGEAIRPLPGVDDGVTGFVGVGAVLPERPIRSIVITVETPTGAAPRIGPLDVDHVLTCHTSSTVAPLPSPEPPEYGTQPVTTDLAAELLIEHSPDPLDPGHGSLSRSPLTGITTTANGTSRTIPSRLVEPEGERIALRADETVSTPFGDARFLYWRATSVAGRDVFFPRGQIEVGWILTHDFTATAVYTLADRTGACRFLVDSESDEVDARPGDGQCRSEQGHCTLRAAVQESNSAKRACTIVVPHGTYGLTLTGRGEDESVRGDLDVLGEAHLLGAGRQVTVIDGNENDTVLDVRPGAFVHLSGVTIQGGAGEGYPGGINNGGRLTIMDAAVTGNRSTGNAGGIWNGAQLRLIHTTVSGNSARLNGGGVYNRDGDLTIERTSIDQNRTESNDGGGIANNGGAIRILASDVSGNHAARNGGGVANDSDVSLTNTTISMNRSLSGGGLFQSGGRARLTHVTVAHNRAIKDAGGIHRTGGEVTLLNSLLADNHADGVSWNCGGRLLSDGHNLIETTHGCSLEGRTGDDRLDVEADLAPLDRYGGATRTHALREGSPAVDAIRPDSPACPALDQRDRSRPGGEACDIGAYERQAAEWVSVP